MHSGSTCFESFCSHQAAAGLVYDNVCSESLSSNLVTIFKCNVFLYKKRVVPTAEHIACLSQAGLVLLSVSNTLVQKLCPVRGVDNSLLSKQLAVLSQCELVGIGSLLIVSLQH